MDTTFCPQLSTRGAMVAKRVQKVKGRISIALMKRCFFKGAKIEFACPGCGKNLSIDYGSKSVEYPEVGQKIMQCVYCMDCKMDISFPIEITSANAHITAHLDQMTTE